MEQLRMFRLFSPNVRAVIIYAVMEGLVFGVFQTLFNYYVLSIPGFDASFAGNVTSATSTASLLIALPAAWVAGKVPARPIMILSGLAHAASLAGMVMLPSPASLIGFNVINGVAVTFRVVALAPFMMANTSPTERQYAFSFQLGMALIADFIGSTVGGVLPTLFGGLILVEPTSTPAYQLAIGGAAFVGLVSILPLLLINSASAASDVPQLDWSKLPQYAGQIGKLLASPFAIGLGAGLMVPFFNVYFRNVYAQSDSTYGLLRGLAVLGMGLAQFVAPPLAKRVGKINTVLLTQAVSIPFLIILGLGAYLVPAGLGDIQVWFLIAAAVFIARNTLMNLSHPVYQTFVLEHVDREAVALTASLNSMAFQIGWAFCPSIAGWLVVTYEPFGFVPIYGATTLLYIIGTIILYAFFGKTEREEKAAAAAEAQVAAAK